MSRRLFLRFGLAFAALLFGTGHTPYRQWSVYRKRYLLILCSKTDPQAVALSRQLAELLATHLPSSRARITRAPHDERIASLISSGQLDVALMHQDAAEALLHGRPPFSDYGPLSLRSLITSGEYLLVCRDDFPAQHAYLVSKTLLESASEDIGIKLPSDETPIVIHQGTSAYRDGLALPAPPAKADVPAHDH